MKPAPSIKTRIIFSILTVIFFFGSLATISVFYFSRNYLISQKKLELFTLTQDKAEDINLTLKQLQTVAKKISQTPKIITALNQPSPSTATDINLSLQHRDLPEIFSALYVMDTTGLTLASTEPSFIGKNYSFRPYFQQALQGEAYTDIGLGVTSNKIGLYLSFPILNDQQQILGVLVTKVKPEVITQLLNNQSLLATADTLLTDDQGVIFFSKKPDRLYHSLGQLTPQQTQLEQSHRFPQKEINFLEYQVIQDHISQSATSKSVEFTHPTNQESQIITLVKISDFPFYLIIKQNIDNIIKVANSATIFLALLVISAATFAAIFISLLISSLLSPLEQLTLTAKEYSKGNFDHQPSIKTRSRELSQLTQALIHMAKTTKATQTNIKKQIDQKTAKLQQINRFLVNRELKMAELKEKIKNNQSTKKQS